VAVPTFPAILNDLWLSHLLEAIFQGVFVSICVELPIDISTFKEQSFLPFEVDCKAVEKATQFVIEFI